MNKVLNTVTGKTIFNGSDKEIIKEVNKMNNENHFPYSYTYQLMQECKARGLMNEYRILLKGWNS